MGELQEKKLLNVLLNVVLNTAGAAPMHLYESHNKVFANRSQLHLLVIQNMGTNKSGIIDAFPEENKTEVTEYTIPALCGTITQEGMFTPGILHQTINKTLIIDEAQNLTTGAKLALLSFLEKQKYQRSLGYDVMRPIKEGNFNSDGYEINVEKNLMQMKYRFNCLNFSTRIPIPSVMKELRDAWMSRFVVFKTHYNINDIMRLTRGDVMIKLNKKEYTGGVHFKKYLDFHKMYYLSASDTLNLKE